MPFPEGKRVKGIEAEACERHTSAENIIILYSRMKKYLVPAIYAVGALLVAFVLYGAVKYRYDVPNRISVTGMTEKEFVSDLIVWKATVTVKNRTLEDGYKELARQNDLVREYLKEKQIPENEAVFLSVSSFENTTPIYSNGNYIGSRPDGYTLTQQIRIESKNVELVESISRDISVLIAQNVNIQSDQPDYYYSKLEDLKLSLIAEATANGKERADQIAEESGYKRGKLASGKMGVFQITGAYSGEDYSWGGTYNTTSKRKIASITVKLEYKIK